MKPSMTSIANQNPTDTKKYRNTARQRRKFKMIRKRLIREIAINSNYKQHKQTLTKMPSDTWTTTLHEVSTAQIQTGLSPDNTGPAYSTHFPAGPRYLQFAARERAEVIKQDVLNTAKTALASPIVLAQMKSKSHQFCVAHQSLNAVNSRDFYWLPRRDGCIC